MVRTNVFLMCSECSSRNYPATKQVKETGRLELKKYCRFCRRHTLHKEHKK